LEDDVVFGQDLMGALELALAHCRDWDVLKLNKIRAKQPVRQRRLGGYALNAYIGTATGMGAYLIQRHTVQQLLPVMLPIRRPIDHELDRVHVLDYRLSKRCQGQPTEHHHGQRFFRGAQVPLVPAVAGVRPAGVHPVRPFVLPGPQGPTVCPADSPMKSFG
jgi:GR25 family glycosyltransferase involved in LPS biosynthesis